MATFPTIYVHGTLVHSPVVGDFAETIASDPTIVSQFDGGYKNTRARFTRVARKWTMHYSGVSQANKNTLRTFIEARAMGAESFTWTNPEDSVAYTVRVANTPTYTPRPNSNFGVWDVTFMLEAV